MNWKGMIVGIIVGLVVYAIWDLLIRKDKKKGDKK